MVIFRLGRILTGGARGPGVFFIIPCVDIYEVIDMRVQNFSVPPQEVIIKYKRLPNQKDCHQILSKDSVTVFVNAIMYYKVQDAIKAVTNVDDYAGSAQALAATTLRNVLGTRTLGDILSDRVKIATEMQVKNKESHLYFIVVFSRIYLLKEHSFGEFKSRGSKSRMSEYLNN